MRIAYYVPEKRLRNTQYAIGRFKMNTQTVTGQTEQAALPISLGCSSDTPGIERALVNTPGIVKVYANPVTEMVYVKYDPALIRREQIVTAINQAGFGLTTGCHDD
jgi:copper chaperone CopZ